MDVFGAFQLCAIGILAAPVTVKLSSTYFNDPGRNFIFSWTILILAGLLSLTVKFFRSNTSPCPYNNSGQPLSPDPRLFNYNNPPTCNLTCSTTLGPSSPIRQGSANNIYVVPAPERITFGMGTLLAAACCIPAILHLVTMRNTIAEINWKSRFGNQDVDEQALIKGTNGATLKSMAGVDAGIGKFLIIPEVLVFGVAVLFIVVLGEMNFFSDQVSWQTEPMSTIGKRSSSFILIRWLTVVVPFAGQWTPIVSTILAVLGFLYHIRHKRPGLEEKTNPAASKHPPNPAVREGHRDEPPASSHYVTTQGTIDGRYRLSNGSGRTSTQTVISPLPRAVTLTGGNTPSECVPTTNPPQRAVVWRDGGRLRVARILNALSDFITVPPTQFYDTEFRSGLAQGYPEVPAEGSRNDRLENYRNRYDGNATLQRQHSRAGSFTDSMNSGLGINVEGNTMPRAQPSRRSHSGTFPAERTSGELQNVTSYTSAGSNGDTPRRPSMLEVPPLDHQDRKRTFSAPPITFDDSINQGPSSLAIVFSHDPQQPDPNVS
ncbi:hypothetical protein GP486_000031 [Trichoglossum hirsutum]|uniref:Uncharacterized protein n=1 Tax=Trichoglossum hirsutum TaxID=265104 RepID=A0A9P8LJG9_9PEZI|nr:hypothetical protein GP486_000031 [Trichoglossum hirsutum]